MDFSKRKLPLEARSKLRMCQVETVKPYALMIAPVYVYMRRNEKFISLKAPLDFFTPQELERLKTLETFFMPEFVDSVLPYRDLARRVRIVLGWNPVNSGATIPPVSFEITDGVLRVLAPLWGRRFSLEPFFACVFVNEFCSLLPGEEMVAARDQDLVSFERAIIISAWMVFLSLHIGVADQDYLNLLRLSSFRKVLAAEQGEAGALSLDSRSDAGELYGILVEVLAGENIYAPLRGDVFASRPERVAQKIISRIERVNREGMSGHAPLAGTIYGEKGFVDA